MSIYSISFFSILQTLLIIILHLIALALVYSLLNWFVMLLMHDLIQCLCKLKIKVCIENVFIYFLRLIQTYILFRSIFAHNYSFAFRNASNKCFCKISSKVLSCSLQWNKISFDVIHTFTLYLLKAHAIRASKTK